MQTSSAISLFLVMAPLIAQTPVCSGVDRSSVAHPVYVSPSGGDSSGCGGSLSQSCQTIQQGIHNCTATSCGGVLVGSGLYRIASPIAIANGVNVYGSCIFDGGTIPYRTTVIGASPIFSASGISAATTLSGIMAIGADATQPSQPSHALVLTNGSGLSLDSMTLVSGRGATGGPGGTSNGAGGGGGSYPNGDSGGVGGPACPSNRVAADGDGGQGADIQQVASTGCFVYCSCSNNNYPNSLGRQGHASGSVQGGTGGNRAGTGCGCEHGGDPGDGPVGNPGNPGPCGTTGGTPSTNVIGSFSNGAWVPSQGGSGDTGKVGSGGGGGGSGGYSAWLDGDFHTHDYNGRPGGGGGGGGCGGPGGTGGFQGGASIPLVVQGTSTTINTSAVTLVPGPGGQGGSGATGGQGGSGGPGQVGEPGHQNPINIEWACSGNAPGSGGTGGAGGQGGAGSGGAGGNGGPSFTIALVGSGAQIAGVVVQYAGQPGPGGTGTAGGQNASSQCQGAKGTDGAAGSNGGAESMVTYP